MTELIYLASPYAHPDERVRERRYLAAMHVVAESMTDTRRRCGRRPILYSPIVHNHPMSLLYKFPREWAFWRALDFPMLERCDRVIVLQIEGWRESVSVAAEIEHARILGKPVHFIEQWRDYNAKGEQS